MVLVYSIAGVPSWYPSLMTCGAQRFRYGSTHKRDCWNHTRCFLCAARGINADVRLCLCVWLYQVVALCAMFARQHTCSAPSIENGSSGGTPKPPSASVQHGCRNCTRTCSICLALGLQRMKQPLSIICGQSVHRCGVLVLAFRPPATTTRSRR